LLELHGLSREQITAWGGSQPQPYAGVETVAGGPLMIQSRGAEMTSRGEVDGFLTYVYWTSGWARELTTLLNLKFLRFDEAAVDSVARELGGLKMTLPAGLFPGADDDMPVLGWHHLYVYGPLDTDPDLVRAILRGLDQVGDSLLDNAHALSYSRSPVQLEPGVRFHPAAEEFYAASARAAVP
jgi:hypothetical protein